ncbi:hypothetical protein GBAR_LOCUS28697 [Geodia barretti]|uniref:Uncharacterized protein n=1 Tax=Geodia barretti TaxID=519541 RepID=A0AA35XCK5_GEOBA|nr:hypothetical protein GBAR_LOCUS28697 [Geodia barretti]
MSTKPSSKAAKHSAQGHGGKKGETTDPHISRGGDASSPTGSMMSGAGEGGSITVHPLDAVLTGDEIQALRITDEKLQKLRSPVESPASSHHLPPKQVMVRRTGAPADLQSRKKRLKLLGYGLVSCMNSECVG